MRIRYEFIATTVCALTVAAIFIAPGWVRPGTVQLITFILIAIVLAQSINVLTGLAGEISLGHAGLFGIGAYASGVLAEGAPSIRLRPLRSARLVRAPSGSCCPTPPAGCGRSTWR